MTTDFRTLLENLVEEVLDANQYKPPGVQRAIDRARAALAEPEPEGPTPQPVPVSERLPGPEDCDELGRCWWFNDEDGAFCSHWLPAHALPQPS